VLPRPSRVIVTLAAAVALAVTCLVGPAAAAERLVPSSATGPEPLSRTVAASQIACQFKSHIWVMNASGGERRQVTHSVGYNPAGQSQPAWSPDGRRLAFIDFTGVTDGTGCRLWLVDANGANQHRVDVMGSSESLAMGASPAWSPDGGRIAFVNVMNLGGNPENAWEALFSYDFVTGQTTQLCRVATGELIEGMTWSAGGLKIELSVDNSSAVQIGQIHGRSVRQVSRLRSIDLASHRVSTLATAPKGTRFAGIARSPDGRSVAVALSRASGSQRFAILTGPMGGKPTHTVVRAQQATTDFRTVSWSPTGRQLAYGIYTPNGSSTWIIGLNGKNDHKLLAGASWPAWGPRSIDGAGGNVAR
jgi:Tol biopolymer transport system component